MILYLLLITNCMYILGVGIKGPFLSQWMNPRFFKIFMDLRQFFDALDYYYIDVVNDIQPSISPFFRPCNFIKVARRMSDIISTITIIRSGVL